MGRGIEHRMLARLGEIALERGIEFVELSFVPTQKNRPALEFLESIGEAFRASAGRGFTYRIPAVVAARVQYVPAAVKEQEEESAGWPPMANEILKPTAEVRSNAALLNAIAAELHSAEEIHKVISTRTQLWQQLKRPSVAAETPVEQRVAGIWSELLGLQQVGRNDTFFDLGGHSLLAMQFMVRLRNKFNVELRLRDLFDNPTIEGVALQLMSIQAAAMNGAQLSQLFAELESLPVEEPAAKSADKNR